tara:strand:+ start:1643 stop:1846 length:204 start_codon:yes stop_codon:yes gene_type:complete
MQFSIEVGELVSIRQFGHRPFKANKTGIVISRRALGAGSKYEQEAYEVLTYDGVIVRVRGTRLRKAD